MYPAHAIEAYEGVEVELHASSALVGSGRLNALAAGTHRWGNLAAPRACPKALNKEIVP